MTSRVRMPEERFQRIAPLSSLPVFMQLAGRPAAVIGGTAAAAWKAELLAAAGARVTVIAEELGPEMAAMIAAGVATPVGPPRRWQPSDLAAAAIVVADCSRDTEAAAIHAAARSAGVPCNVIDKPAYCDFIFGSIVNRSPVIAAISTDGAAPVLGQAIRSRLEAMLPAGLGCWAAVAKSLRSRVAEALPGHSRRTRFWNRVAETSLAPTHSGDPATSIEALLTEEAANAAPSGRVTIVGAGPGSSDYLTLAALRALQAADVILFDSLVQPEVLDFARREARRIDVGKRGARGSCRQDDINRLAIQLAKQGSHVVRLKSGDPSIFGRAGEEIAECKAAGVPVEIVPGITAALAMAARLGASLTDRRWAHSVRLITGHATTGALAEGLDWAGIADPETTLVFYMAGRTAAGVGDRLLAHGLSDETPIAVASDISGQGEAFARGRLGQLPAIVETFDLELPILIGVGQVFAEDPKQSLVHPADQRRTVSNTQPTGGR